MLDWLSELLAWLEWLSSMASWSEWVGQWWASLDFTYQFFFFIGFFSTGLLFLLVFLQMLGVGDGMDVDVSSDVDSVGDADADAGVGFFSFRSLVGFFAGFGWVGMITIEYGLSNFAAIGIGILGGGVIMAMIYGMLVFIMSLREHGTADFASAVGEIGDVYFPIPPLRQGTGKIEVMVSGRLKVVDAMNRADHKLETRSKVRVVDKIDSSTLLVEPLTSNDDQTESNPREDGQS